MSTEGPQVTIETAEERSARIADLSRQVFSADSLLAAEKALESGVNDRTVSGIPGNRSAMYMYQGKDTLHPALELRYKDPLFDDENPRKGPSQLVGGTKYLYEEVVAGKLSLVESVDVAVDGRYEVSGKKVQKEYHPNGKPKRVEVYTPKTDPVDPNAGTRIVRTWDEEGNLTSTKEEKL